MNILVTLDFHPNCLAREDGTYALRKTFNWNHEMNLITLKEIISGKNIFLMIYILIRNQLFNDYHIFFVFELLKNHKDMRIIQQISTYLLRNTHFVLHKLWSSLTICPIFSQQRIKIDKKWKMNVVIKQHASIIYTACWYICLKIASLHHVYDIHQTRRIY